VKRYEWVRLGPYWPLSGRPLEKGTPVDLNDPSLPDEILEINPDADAFANPDED
jgi:hypothetical protein